MTFNVLAVLISLLAVATVVTPHIFRSAIYLMGVLSLSAGLYLLLGAEFLAGVQVLVYVGGILVLLVFAVMLTQSQDLREDRPTPNRKLAASLASIAFFAISAFALKNSIFTMELSLEPKPTAVTQIGRAFLSSGADGYLLPFELISLLLLTVLIAGIVLAKKEKS